MKQSIHNASPKTKKSDQVTLVRKLLGYMYSSAVFGEFIR